MSTKHSFIYAQPLLHPLECPFDAIQFSASLKSWVVGNGSARNYSENNARITRYRQQRDGSIQSSALLWKTAKNLCPHKPILKAKEELVGQLFSVRLNSMKALNTNINYPVCILTPSQLHVPLSSNLVSYWVVKTKLSNKLEHQKPELERPPGTGTLSWTRAPMRCDWW